MYIHTPTDPIADRRLNLIIAVTLLQYYTGGGLDNWLDAVDESYCDGDDPIQVGTGQLFSYSASPHDCEFLFQDGIYADTAPGGYDGRYFLENVVSQSN